MGFLGKLFGKEPGGSIVGNLFRGVANKATGGILGTGANRIEIGQTETNAELAKKGLVAQGGITTTFAGQPVVKEPDGTYAMIAPLEEVNISTSKAKTETAMPAWVDKIGDVLSNLGGRATEQTKVGVDNNTLLVLGGVGFAIVAVLAMNGNNKR